ncbi:uncharacterized protein [Miscanthus floridulus]|uniref:uncharacterized protein n=1 Tax=Miscanthus floridulus TaxID=154761 RepID=UPI0034587D3C
MVKTTAGQRHSCSRVLVVANDQRTQCGIAGSMDNEANVFDEMGTRVTEMSSPPLRASTHRSLSSGTRLRDSAPGWPRCSLHSGVFSSSGCRRHLKARVDD